MIRKYISLLIIGLLVVFFTPVFASAQGLDQACQIDDASTLCQNTREDPSGSRLTTTIRNAANLISIVSGIAGVVMVMLGGFRYIRSSGDPGKIGEAQNTIIYAVVGLVVAASGQLLVAFVLNRL